MKYFDSLSLTKQRIVTFSVEILFSLCMAWMLLNTIMPNYLSPRGRVESQKPASESTWEKIVSTVHQLFG